MKTKVIKVLGTGCANCVRTEKLIQSVVDELASEVTVEKEQSIEKIMGYGVMATPAVVIDEQVVHVGGVPSRAQVLSWLGE